MNILEACFIINNNSCASQHEGRNALVRMFEPGMQRCGNGIRLLKGAGFTCFLRRRKRLIHNLRVLTAAAQKVIQDSGLIKQRARVALVLDMSAGMEAVFQSGTAEKVCQRLLALAVHFDDNGAIDVFVCGEKRECLGELTPDNFAGYIDNEIRAKYKATGDASFGSMVEQVIKKYTTEKGDPAL